MNPRRWLQIAWWFLAVVSTLVFAGNASAAWKEKVLYSFQGGSDGYQPAGGVVFDKAGNLYGVNSWGGSGGCPDPGCGIVFELSPPTQKGGPWTETTIYAFQGVLGKVKDGFTPEGSVIIDQAGNLYGTTSLGGNGPCILLGSATGCGIVYELSPPKQKGGQWSETILHNFKNGTDGYFPWGDLVFDKSGNLYGATQFGGGEGTACNQFFGGTCGTVFKLHPPSIKNGKWKEDILHSFAGVAKKQQSGDGANPNGNLTFDSSGALYGTTYFGGNNEAGKCRGGVGGTGCGIVFELIPPSGKRSSWTEKTLHMFQGIPDGINPAAGVRFGSDGSLYGTTKSGGREGTGGTVFEVKRASTSDSWTERVLYRFTDRADGANPTGVVSFDAADHLYGTATTGRAGDSVGGNVFRLKPGAGKEWTLGVLHGFAGNPDGFFAASGIIFDKQGSIYGTTQQGGTGGACLGGCGAVFELSP
jgi:hypothetical protein